MKPKAKEVSNTLLALPRQNQKLFNSIQILNQYKLKEKESESRSALELIQCAILFGNTSQKALGAELLFQKLQSLKQKLLSPK